MRLIDADALLADYIVSGTTTNKPVKRYTSEESISYAPTIDAVEVVRCKDCKWYDPSEPLSTISPVVYRCGLYGTYHIPEFFCSVGERRIDETD